jgi:hypothetical protein
MKGNPINGEQLGGREAPATAVGPEPHLTLLSDPQLPWTRAIKRTC